MVVTAPEKIAVVVCEKLNGRCTTTPCFRAFNEKRKHFERYRDSGTQLSAFVTCQACSSGSLDKLQTLGKKLKKQAFDTVHLATCIPVECTTAQQQDLVELFSNLDMTVHVGSH